MNEIDDMKLSYLNFLPINCKPLQKAFLNYRMSLTQILHNKNCEYFYQGIKLNFQWGKDSIKNNLVLYISFIILSLEEHFGELTAYGENVEIDTRVVDGGKILYSVFLTQIISRRQKNADAEVALSISRRQKWNSRRQFSIFKKLYFTKYSIKRCCK